MVLPGVILFASLLAARSDHALTAADSGKTISVSKWDRITVTLGSNPSTGYMWKVKDLPKGVLHPAETVYSPDQQGVPGAPGKVTFSFTVEGRPKGKIRLEYVRDWEKNVAPANVFEVTLSSQPTPRAVIYDGQQSLRLHVGEVLVVPFNTNAGTAGVATAVRVPAFLKRLPDLVDDKAADPHIVGGPQTVNLRFQAVKSGKGSLEIVVRSPGQPDAPLVSTVVRASRSRKR